MARVRYYLWKDSYAYKSMFEERLDFYIPGECGRRIETSQWGDIAVGVNYMMCWKIEKTLDCYFDSARKYRKTEKYKVYQNNYQKTEKYKIVKNKRRRERTKIDVEYHLTHILRVRLWKALKGNYKSGSAIKDLGCSISELKQYLENQFQEGMSWENYGYRIWHIDHIIPLSSFDLTDYEQLKKACHYTNLQPLFVNIHKEKTYNDLYA